MRKRIAQLNEQFKREISDTIRREIRDPRIGGVTVTGVGVTPDLMFAKVHVHLSGGARERGETMKGLRAAAPFIRRKLGREMHIRRVPALEFKEDRTLEEASRIEELLREVLGGEGGGE